MMDDPPPGPERPPGKRGLVLRETELVGLCVRHHGMTGRRAREHVEAWTEQRRAAAARADRKKGRLE
jgi:hypothetical protein